MQSMAQKWWDSAQLEISTWIDLNDLRLKWMSDDFVFVNKFGRKQRPPHDEGTTLEKSHKTPKFNYLIKSSNAPFAMKSSEAKPSENAFEEKNQLV